MSWYTPKKNIISMIDKNIKHYNKNIIISCTKYDDKQLIQKISQYVISKGCEKDICIWTSIDRLQFTDLNIWYLSKYQLLNVINLYYMYEFSDKVIILSDNPQYPSMFNYIIQGILSEQEMIEGLLY